MLFALAWAAVGCSISSVSIEPMSPSLAPWVACSGEDGLREQDWGAALAVRRLVMPQRIGQPGSAATISNWGWSASLGDSEARLWQCKNWRWPLFSFNTGSALSNPLDLYAFWVSGVWGWPGHINRLPGGIADASWSVATCAGYRC